MADSFYGPNIDLSRRGLLQVMLEAVPPAHLRDDGHRELIERFIGTFRLSPPIPDEVEQCVERRRARKIVGTTSTFDALAAYAAALEQAFGDRRISPKEKTYLKLFGGLLGITPEQHAEAVRRVKQKLDQSGVIVRHPPELSVPEVETGIPASLADAVPAPQPAKPAAPPSPPPVSRKQKTGAQRPQQPSGAIRPTVATPTVSRPVPWQPILIGLAGLSLLVVPALRFWDSLQAQREPTQAASKRPAKSSSRRVAAAMEEAAKESKAKNYAKAERLLREAAGLAATDSQKAELATDLGWVLCKLGRYPDAEKEFAQSIELVPGDAQAHCGLGVCRKETKRNDEAIVSLSKALELKDDFTQARFLLALCLIGKNDIDGALPLLRRVVKDEPGNIDAQMVLTQYEAKAGKR